MILSVEEHKTISAKELEKLGSQKDECRKALETAFKAESKAPRKTFLGIDGAFKASYYVGCSWLKEPSSFDDNGIAIQVKPKVDVDYVKMFVTALNVVSDNEAEYFSDYYGIDFNATAVKIDTEDDLVTPLLLLHYLSLLTVLAKSGLKKGYIRKEENLQSKVRGKILFSQHLKQNVFNKRNERTYCVYQEYTVNTPENRLLKKALMYVRDAVLHIPSLKDSMDVLQNISYLENIFEDVSEDISLTQVNVVRESKLFRHYSEATKVAKMILQHFDYGIEHDERKAITHSIRPFYIDMSRLYEMYVFHKLNAAYPGQIKFQVAGRHKTQVDYIKIGEEKIVLDAKYKPRYEKGNSGIVDDVREISGYARDKKILKALGWNAEIDGKAGKLLPDCVIVYPVVQVEENDDGDSVDVVAEANCRSIDELNTFDSSKTIVEQCDEIKAFEGFYKIAVPLPSKKSL